MFPETADWLEMKLEPVSSKKILNAGSNTFAHYHDDQHWIWEKVLWPLRRRHCKIFNADIKPETRPLPDGIRHHTIDLVDCGTFFGNEFFDVVLCTSVIEHVEKPKEVMGALREVIDKNGVLWLEAPAVYPIHHDPIDNGLRLKSQKECEEFLGPAWKIEEYAEVESERFPGDGTVGKGVIVKARPI